MIKIKGTKNLLVALESVAMTDIVLNMFIFFFISFSLIYTYNPTRISRIEVKLPRASSAVALEGSEKVVLDITKAGEYYINSAKVKAADLRRALEAKQKEDPEMSLLLKVDGSSKFNNVVRALDIINELNIQKVSVATVKKTSDK